LGAYIGYYFVGNFFNLILPTSVGGDVARAWYLGRGTGRGSCAAMCVLADRLIGLYVLVAMACVAACVVPLPSWIVLLVAAFGCGAVAGLGFLWLLVRFGAGRWRRAEELISALAFYCRSPRLLLSASLLSLVVQILNVLLVFCIAHSLHIHYQGQVDFGFCCVLMPIVALVTLAPISVNGMGVREGAMILLLNPLGIPAEQAVTLSLLWFSVFLAAGLVGAAWYLSGYLPRCEVPSDAQSLRGDPHQRREREPAAVARPSDGRAGPARPELRDAVHR
jgi:uncharacterized membrane protein YbhN (UPF0104 family)